jgi:hypothetical protein
VKRTAVRVLYEAKTLLAPHPLLALPATRWRARSGHGEAVDHDTDLVVEGYPRSANNFALAALQSAQPEPARIAHHTHAPATVVAGVRWGIPVLLLVRDPEDAVLEFVIRRPALSVAHSLRGYIRFYEPLLPYRYRIVVGSFDEVTTDFGAVIRRLNHRFGTEFSEFEHTPENVRTCFAAIERHYRTQYGDDRFEQVVARPSGARDRIKAALRPSYQEVPEEIRARARALQGAFVGTRSR